MGKKYSLYLFVVLLFITYHIIANDQQYAPQPPAEIPVPEVPTISAQFLSPTPLVPTRTSRSSATVPVIPSIVPTKKALPSPEPYRIPNHKPVLMRTPVVSNALPSPPASRGYPGHQENKPFWQESQLVWRLLAMINQDREEYDLPPYHLSPILSNVARQHSIRMMSCGLAHICPGEPESCQRVLNAGVHYSLCGENVGKAVHVSSPWEGIRLMHQNMMGEPESGGHRRNLLNSEFHEIGIGLYRDFQGVLWLTEDFTS